MSKFQSDEFAAQQAVSGLMNMNDVTQRKIGETKSDITSIKNGVELTNELLQPTQNLANQTKKTAQAIPDYAKKVSLDDKNDQAMFNIAEEQEWEFD